MIKKLVTLMLVFNIFMVEAYAASRSGLRSAFDEMNYALTVEWDQKDQSFYEAQIKKFDGVVRELQKQGLTNSQMIDFAVSEAKDSNVAKDLETAFSMITINKMSSEEASEYMMESMKRSYSSGASWSGDINTYLLVGLLVIVIALSAANKKDPVIGNGTWTGGDGEYCYDDCFYRDYNCDHGQLSGAYCESSLGCDRVCR